MLRRTVWLSGLLVALAATAVQAQDQKKGGGRGGFGQGPGGFGIGGLQASGAQLIGIPEVLNELAVSDEQKGLLKDMEAEMGEQRRRAFGGGGGFDPNMSEEERRKLFEEFNKRREEQNKKADEMISMILEPKQLERLNQLKVQRDGVFGLIRDDMAQKLGLSAEQREKMTKIRDEAFPRPTGGGGGGGFQAFRDLRNASDEEKAAAKAKFQEEAKKGQERLDKARTEMLAVLTAAQKESFEKMQGKKFEFPPAQFGFGGGGPGGGAAAKKKGDDK